MSWSKKQYFVEYESDRFDSRRYNNATGEYGSNIHEYVSHASTIQVAKTYIKRIRKEYASENPRNFKVYDMWGDVDERTNYVPCVYQEK